MSDGDRSYQHWAASQARGLIAAREGRAQSRMSGETLAQVRRATRERFPCKVKGCKRTAHKGDLCKAHWSLVPYADKVALQMAVMDAQLKTAAKWHRKFLRQVNAQLATPSRV